MKIITKIATISALVTLMTACVGQEEEDALGNTASPNETTQSGSTTESTTTASTTTESTTTESTATESTTTESTTTTDTTTTGSTVDIAVAPNEPVTPIAPTTPDEPNIPTQTPTPPNNATVTAAFSGDATQGKVAFERDCAICHVDQEDGTFTPGVSAFDVNNLSYPNSTKYAGYTAASVEELSRFIDDNMPSADICKGECANDVAAYLWTYLDETSAVASGEVFATNASCQVQDQLLASQVRRLSQTQIENSIVDIFGDVFDDDIFPNMEDGAKLIGMNFLADKLNINNLNMERLYDSSRLIVQNLMEENPEINQCLRSGSDSCVTGFVSDYGTRLWRRPLSEQETEDINSALNDFATNEDKLEFLFNAFLLSSNFLFRSEIGQAQADIQVLDNYELVSVLSYTLWNSTPDDTLLDLAAKSSPLTEAELTQQITRMFNEPRANEAMMEVYKDYLKLDLVLTRNKGDAFNFTTEVRQDILASAENMLIDNIATNPNYMDVFGGNEYPINNNTAYLFDVDVGTSAFERVAIDPNQRSGILNHPAFLSVHSTLTGSGIVQRGVFSLEQMLCSEIPDPPEDINSVGLPPDIDPETTSERDLLLITHSAQGICQACHDSIDPAGFGFENFDAIGRYRTTEKNNVTIDASGVLDTVGEHVLTYDNSAEYSRALTGSPQMNHCVSKRFLEHYLGQTLKTNDCELQKYQGMLEETDGSVQDLIYSLIKLESFSKRKAAL